MRTLGKSRGGVVDNVYNANNTWEFDNSGNYIARMSGAKLAA